eukprot:5130377-Amphidinium_carterae.1
MSPTLDISCPRSCHICHLSFLRRRTGIEQGARDRPQPSNLVKRSALPLGSCHLMCRAELTL